MVNPFQVEPLVGQLLDGRYQVVREIAVGGMSTVYEATHVKIGRTVAIKVLHRDMAGDPELVGRFINEARAVGTFGHPNIVASTDFGELPGRVPYLVLEYLRGHTLSDEISRQGPLSVRRAVRIGIQIASALEAAHMREVIHRDLTSSNVFLTQTRGNPDHVKVLDFGISKFLSATETSPKTKRGLTMGTPEFMAPEQIADPQAIDARVDIYALGVILYHMLAGRPPFQRMPLQSLLTQIVLDAPPPIARPGIPEEITTIVMCALAKTPAERYSSMRQFGMELEKFGSRSFSSAFLAGITEAVSAAREPSVMVAPASPPSDGTETIPGATPPLGIPSPTSVPSQVAPTTLRAEPPRRAPLAYAALAAAVAVVGGAVLMNKRQPQPAPGMAAPVSTPAPVPIAAASVPKAEAEAASPPIHLAVTSPTAQARMTLRGRTHLLPFDQELKPGSQPEIVELTAPKHEGRRFWITFDRSMALRADLPTGHGVIEASEEETVVALGERPVPDRPGPSAREGGRPASDRPSKHGHPGVERPKSVELSSEPAVAAKPSALEHPAAETPAPAASAPVVKSEPPTIAPPASAQRPSGTATVKAALPAARPSGLDPAKTQAVVRGHLAEVERCYERGKMDYPELKGRVTLRISVATTGAVTSAAVESSSLGNSLVETCMVSAVQAWRFPAPAGGPAVISYPFNLR